MGLPKDTRRSYNVDDMPACNWNGMAATIVDDIRFNTKTHKRPKAASIAYWQAYFKGCSEQKVRTAIRDALASGLLKVTYKMFNGSNTPHYLYVGTGVEFNTPVEINTPHVEFNTTITDSISSSNKNLNIQNAGSGNTPASTSPVISEQSGKGVTPKHERASEPFLKIGLEKKLEFIAANDNGENVPSVLAELTPDDRKTAQRLEFGLTKAGLDPMEFMNWLTLSRYQHVVLHDLATDAQWSLLVVMSHRGVFFDAYRAHLDSLKFYTKKTPAHILKASSEWPPVPLADHAKPAPLLMDDYEQCNEPPDDYPKAAKSHTELMREDLLRQQQAKAKGIKLTAAASMWQPGMGKHAKAVAA